ncbi:hypothetical protein B0F90DRAFT_1700407 [Multifurca ochricompacta]|uniref:Uncharacterized protein n=1 Tax=Multifurca ochricompacta TaxID=376703 RepID=A0AAD4MAX6_9AGAM|nr:hypothetical protein B0F90DRAFT_1700407 [Multifurca ochricompacta]
MKYYIERGVQAGSYLLQSRVLTQDADLLAPSPEDPSLAIGDPQLLPPLTPSLQVSPAYSLSKMHGSPISKMEVSHAVKPRQLPQMKPSTHRHSSIRVFSLPEDSPSITGKAELNLVQRVVSMPEQRLVGSQPADSSLSTEGFDGSMLSGGSFLSGTDTTSDSVLIIENNCGLSEAFLSNQSTSQAAPPPSEKKIAMSDEGWITWARSPPRPIPALHGPLSLPYARCPSGAEGTIIEEPDNLPRVIWGLDSEEHHASDFGIDFQMKKPELTARTSQLVNHSRQYRPSNENHSASMVTQPSVSSVRSPQGMSQGDFSYGNPKPAISASHADVIYSRNPYNETIVLENLVDRRTTKVAHQNRDHDGVRDLTRTLEHNLHFRESEIELLSNKELERDLLSRPYGSGSQNLLSSSRSSCLGLPAMKVSSRPAIGSALPQILIEPRSPEISQPLSRRMTAMELAHQYQQQQQQHQLLKIQQQNLLPTPPNSSSPIWSAEFSPYNHHSVSPASLRHQVVQEQLRDSEMPDQVRHLVQERLARNIVHDPHVSPLAPAAHINPASRLDYPDYELDPVTSQALTNLLATQDVQHLPPLSSEVILPVARAPQTLPGYLSHDGRHDGRRYVALQHDALLSPASPEEFRFTRASSQHQIPRSIPLGRLMQRRLSSVPEEDSTPAIHGRSPSPPQLMRHGTDRQYYRIPARHGYQYANTLESSANYSGTYLESASRGLRGKVRGSVLGSKNSSVGTDGYGTQGRYRGRHEGNASEKESAVVPRRSGSLRKTRGRLPKLHAN